MKNYEERYKKALERARIGLHDCNLLDCDDMTRRAAITTIYHLFPELAEDKDERIRKGIIRNLQYLMDRSEGFVKEDLQERITWLEKQESVGEIVERCKTSWYNEGKIDGRVEGLSDDEKYQQGWHDALEKQGEQNQIWKPSAAQLIVIKDLIEDKNTSKVHKTILQGMLDEFKQFTNNCKRETDNYEIEDSSKT